MDKANINLEKKFNEFLEENYSNTTNSGNKSTSYSYMTKIKKICEAESCTFEYIANNIDKFITDYDKNGCKSEIGNESHRTVINSLKAYKEFLHKLYEEML